MRLKPKIPGQVIRDPDTRRPLPDEGADVQVSSFWMRRLRDGDVVEIEPTAEPEPETPKPPPATPGEHQERKGEEVEWPEVSPPSPIEAPDPAPVADRMTRSTTRRGQ